MTPRNSVGTIESIANKHGMSGVCVPLKSVGLINDVWSIGSSVILRIPREAEYEAGMLSESVAWPLAVSKGLLTPKLLVFDNDRDIVSAPYTLAERATGSILGSTFRSPTFGFAEQHWRPVLSALGEQLSHLHQLVDVCPDPASLLNPWWVDHPLEDLSECIEKGILSLDEARWVEKFVSRLESAFAYDPHGTPVHRVLVHHDVHPWNILIQEDDVRMTALLDWGCACFGDPAVDFSGLPLWALPPLLDSYREAGGQVDAGLEGRALWMWLGVALREPLFLDASTFKRHWWRLPEDGVAELRHRLVMMPDNWRQWSV